MELQNACLLTAVCVELLGLYLSVYYVLLYEGKCKWSYGPSCPVDFPLNIFIHSYSSTTEGCAEGLSTSWSAWMLPPLHEGSVEKDLAASYT